MARVVACTFDTDAPPTARSARILRWTETLGSILSAMDRAEAVSVVLNLAADVADLTGLETDELAILIDQARDCSGAAKEDFK